MERTTRTLRSRIETRAVNRAADAFLHAPDDRGVGRPVTVAAKDCVVSGDKVMVLGVTVTLMSGGGGGVGADEEVEPPPQPQTPITAAIARAIALGWNLTFGSNLVRPIVRGHIMISSSSRFLSRLAQVRRDWRKAD